MSRDFRFRLPNASERTTVLGRTGTGKTVLGAWVLSEQNFDRMPWVVIDYKGDELFDGIGRIRDIGPNEMPRQPGLYRMQPHPVRDAEKVEAWLINVWERGHTGIFVDEMFMLPNQGAFEGILTQGRSKRIPVIALSQRPAWITRYAYSEADHFFIFHLNTDDDKLKVKKLINGNAIETVPEFHSWYYSVKSNTLAMVKPVPKTDEIQSRIEERLEPKRRFL